MQFSAKNLPNNELAQPFWELVSPSGKSWLFLAMVLVAGFAELWGYGYPFFCYVPVFFFVMRLFFRNELVQKNGRIMKKTGRCNLQTGPRNKNHCWFRPQENPWSATDNWPMTLRHKRIIIHSRQTKTLGLIHTKRKRKFPPMSVVFSVIFFAFASVFTQCERVCLYTLSRIKNQFLHFRHIHIFQNSLWLRLQ